MAGGNPFYSGPAPGMLIAQGIAQGAQNAVQGYQAQQMRQQQVAQMQMKAQLQQMQMEKLRQEVAPVTFKAQNLKMIYDLAGAGVDVPSSVVAKHTNDFVDSIKTPAQQMAASELTRSYIQQKTQGAPAGAASFGLSTDTGPARGAPSLGADTQMPRSDMSAQAYSAPVAPSGDMTLSRPEYNAFRDALKSRGQQALMGTRMQGMDNIERTKAQAHLDELDSKFQNLYSLAEKHGADAKELAKINGEYKLKHAQIAGDYGLQTADMRAKATVQAAKVRAAAPKGGAGAQDPVEKSILGQIATVNKQIASTMGGKADMFALPGADQQKVQALQGQVQKLQQTYQAHTGKPYPGTEPAAPAAQTPAGTGPAKALPFDQWKAAPIGSLILGTDGKTVYKKLDNNGNAEPVAQ